MNQQVKEELKFKLDDRFRSDMKDLKLRLASMMVQTDEKFCDDVECLNELDRMIGDSNNFLGSLAKAHGIPPHDLIEEVLKIMLKGNDYARKLEATAEAFKDDKHVGFC